MHLLLAKDQVAGRLPSVVGGVVRDGELVWHGSHAAAGFATGPEVQYRIGSITKTLVAVLVLQLRDQSRLDLNDRLDAHLPGVRYGDRTIRSLLSHSSGMHSEPAGEWWERTPGGSFDDLAEHLADVPPAFPAGATFHYTNVAFGLLGELVARLTGRPWFDAVRERLLAPLGMTRTTYLPEPPHADGWSVHHFAGTLDPEPSHDAGAMAPAGQVWSTVEDLARYAAFLVAGHPDVLSPATLEEMSTPQSGSLAGALAGGYGLGFRLVSGGSGLLHGHTGSMPGFLAGLFVDRKRRTGAVVLANGTAGLRAEGLPVDLLNTLEELEPTVPQAWQPVTEVPEEVREVLGVWHWGNTAFAFAWDGSHVVAGGLQSGLESYRFALRDGVLVGTSGYHHGETLQVGRAADGTVTHLVCATFVYTRVPYDPAAPVPGGLPATGPG
ncbi:class A beta-lactamase-related serine hydrolase [Nocardioides iriomotensis]|uniref:Class A beta-lactamase-related serine hydrolase n=1 Tax=Nocardioides iriomotensis TaxID=715784 RepID=A0A4Q5J2J4_9ACTN|nr:class A beta-lactamase-related serine hydrolase [Nocardioides iriomotensis]